MWLKMVCLSKPLCLTCLYFKNSHCYCLTTICIILHDIKIKVSLHYKIRYYLLYILFLQLNLRLLLHLLYLYVFLYLVESPKTFFWYIFLKIHFANYKYKLLVSLFLFWSGNCFFLTNSYIIYYEFRYSYNILHQN